MPVGIYLFNHKTVSDILDHPVCSCLFLFAQEENEEALSTGKINILANFIMTRFICISQRENIRINARLKAQKALYSFIL